jgi:hypothetical protein
MIDTNQEVHRIVGMIETNQEVHRIVGMIETNQEGTEEGPDVNQWLKMWKQTLDQRVSFPLLQTMQRLRVIVLGTIQMILWAW